MNKLLLLLSSPYDADAAAWKAAVIANGGTVSQTTMRAVIAFCKQAKSFGLWSKFTRLNLMCGDQLAAALVPIIAGGGNATETSVSFVAGDYSESSGLTGNNSSKYLRTGFIPSANLTANSTHLAIYNRSATAAGQGCLGAWSDATPTNALSMFAPFNNGSFISDEYNTSGGRVSGAVSAPYGLMVGTRTASNLHTTYQRSSQVATNATSGGALPGIECYVFAVNQAGAPNAATYTPGKLAGYSIGSGLSASDVANYNTIMQAFQTALGRNV